MPIPIFQILVSRKIERSILTIIELWYLKEIYRGENFKKN